MDTVLRVMVLMCLPAWGVCESGSGVFDQLESCPTFAGGLSSFHPPLDAYIEDRRSMIVPLVDVIVNGTQLLPSLDSLSSSRLSLHLRVGDEEETLYSAVSVWSGDLQIAPSGCTNPPQAMLLPGEDKEVMIDLACNSVGSVVMQLCVLVGTQPFTRLNGSYTTYTIHITRDCQGPTSPRCTLVRDPTTVAPVEFCATRDQTRRLVEFGAGSWPALIASFDGDEEKGFCLVSVAQSGVNSIFSDDIISRLFAVPAVFPEVVGYFETSSQASSDTFSFSFTGTAENSTIVSEVFLFPREPTSGPYVGRLEFSVMVPCSNEGLTKVTLYFNSSAFIGGILYRRNDAPFFYRNCTKDLNATNVVVINLNHDLGLLVGLPVSLLVIVIAIIVVATLAIMIYLTRRYKHKSLVLEQAIELDVMSFSNAYVKSTFEDPFNFLREYDIEYNYASLDIVGTLGEGAFGRVFKALAPGLARGDYIPEEFVAVKTLKQEAGGDALEMFTAEVKVCVQFEHANVIRLIGVCTQSAHKCMIFEYMDIGGLDKLLRSSDPLNPDYASSSLHLTPEHFLPIVLQVATGLEYLASLKFVHRDVASRNCLIDTNLSVKIADFGLSRITNAMDYYRVGSSNACLPVRWMPPEALLYGKFTVKSDVWSVGVLCWEVYTFGRQPYSGLSNHEVIDKVKSGGVLGCPELCTAPVYNVLQMTWGRSPSKRPSMSVVVDRLKALLSGDTSNAEGYIRMNFGAPGGYLNMNFGTLPSGEELEAAKKVADDLEVQRVADLEVAKNKITDIDNN